MSEFVDPPREPGEDSSGSRQHKAEQRSTARLAAEAAGADGASSPGLDMVRQAVRFTNAEVLNPPSAGGAAVVGMDAGSSALAESAGAMMLQDMRSFLQSTEMVIVPVSAAAFAEILANKPNNGGPATIAEINTLLTTLTKFSAEVIANAAKIQKDFS